MGTEGETDVGGPEMLCARDALGAAAPFAGSPPPHPAINAATASSEKAVKHGIDPVMSPPHGSLVADCPIKTQSLRDWG
jgi:hypothetical protein